uniref:Uncharacterized protein n=1 Tax=Eutreptiella gymnastica TaxID=73025 RepID=A0A7S1N2N0_9EUGL|mmetsp:Transcript_111483/g.193449  ORF Transcript_111483/g.193449 Transcript_111483/m.193449 type:complete len:415 (+) Transcript_111483:50-1294(+)
MDECALAWLEDPLADWRQLLHEVDFQSNEVQHRFMLYRAQHPILMQVWMEEAVKRSLITEDYVAEHQLPDAITHFLFGDEDQLHAQDFWARTVQALALLPPTSPLVEMPIATVPNGVCLTTQEIVPLLLDFASQANLARPHIQSACPHLQKMCTKERQALVTTLFDLSARTRNEEHLMYICQGLVRILQHGADAREPDLLETWLESWLTAVCKGSQEDNLDVFETHRLLRQLWCGLVALSGEWGLVLYSAPGCGQHSSNIAPATSPTLNLGPTFVSNAVLTDPAPDPPDGAPTASKSAYALTPESGPPFRAQRPASDPEHSVGDKDTNQGGNGDGREWLSREGYLASLLVALGHAWAVTQSPAAKTLQEAVILTIILSVPAEAVDADRALLQPLASVLPPEAASALQMLLQATV